MTDRHILTAVAWPYANGPRHIGHVSGFGVPSDVFSRYHRMAGDKVLMVSGTDEHGTPITVAADAEGVTPREIADRNNRIIVDDLASLGLSYDLFTRTTTANHAAVSQEIFLGLLKNGYVFPKTTLGAISPSTGRTLPDRYIEGTCPICGYDGARGDQCDNCGNQLDPIDLINPVSKINGETPKFVEERALLPRPAGVRPGARRLAGHPQELAAQRPQLQRQPARATSSRAATPATSTGACAVPLEGWIDRPDKRIYVWFDAVVGYLSASIEWARRSGDPEAWRQWWQTPDSDAYYFMGKDNIVFHSEIWPAQLLGYNGEGDKGGTAGVLGRLNLPTEVVSSEFLTMEGRKFSSSRNVVIYVRDFLARYDADALRYFIAVAGPENQDTDFTWAEFLRRNNDELVAGWGNLVNRTRVDGGQERRRRPDAGRADRRRPCPAGDDVRRVRPGRRPAVAQPAEGRDQRGDAGRRRGEQVPVGPGAVEAQGGPGPPGHRPAHRAAGDQGLQRPADAVPPALGAAGARAARRHGGLVGRAGGPRGHRPRRRLAVPDHHRAATTRARPAGRPRRWPPSGTPLAPPTPIFTKLDPSIVDEELQRGSEERAANEPARHAARANRRGEPPPSPEPLPVPGDRQPHPPRHRRGGAAGRTGPGTRAGRTTPPWTPRSRPRSRSTSPGWCRSASTSPSSRWSAALAARHPNVLAAVARAPQRGRRGRGGPTTALAEIDRLAAQPRVRAVGETGLDRYRTGPEGWAAQEASFRAHIDIAKRHGVALVIHDRDAHEEILRVLDDEGAPEHTVFHCFSGDAAFARACVERGFVLSFAGTLTFGNAGYLREAAALTPVGPAARGDRRALPDPDAAPRPARTPPGWCR